MINSVLGLFNTVTLPYSYVTVPGPKEKPLKRDTPLVLYVNKVVTRLTLDAFNFAGFVRNEDPQHFNASWGRQFTLSEYKECKSWQKVNHYCGAFLMGRKDNFHLRMTELKSRVGDFVSFYPESYLLPRDVNSLKKVWTLHSKWISKPSASSRGNGIQMHSSGKEPSKSLEGVVQVYIEHPLLITGRKFDIRLYVLVSSILPLRIYIHDSGLGRFATHPYSDDGSLTDLNMHITNFSLNKSDDKFIRGRNDVECVENSKWSLPFLFEYFVKQGINMELLMKEIERVVVSTILAGVCAIRNEHVKSIKTHHTSYELYGLDVILDENLKPYIIEVNISPGMSGLDSKLDYQIKFRLMLELLHIARIIDCDCHVENPCPGIEKLEEKITKSLTPSRIKKVENGSVNPWDDPVFADFVYARDFAEEYPRRKGFRLLYPVKETMDQYFGCFDKMVYSDIVFTKWISMSEEEQLSILKKRWNIYLTEMNDVLSAN